MKTVKLEIPKQPRISSISDESNLIEVDYSKNSINIFFLSSEVRFFALVSFGLKCVEYLRGKVR